MTRCFLFLTLCVLGFGVAAHTAPDEMTFEFREPQQRAYHVIFQAGLKNAPRLQARVAGNSRGAVEICDRVVLQLKAGSDVLGFLKGSTLQLSRTIAPGIYILQAPDAITAATESARFSTFPEVIVSCPVMRREGELRSGYAAQPNDPSFPAQWHLEQRDTNHFSVGVDLNVRAAWPFTQGKGIVVGVADDGIEMTHPDLTTASSGAPHFNFISHTTDGSPLSAADKHATPVAGLLAAALNNTEGGAGVAPEAKVASWKIFNGNALNVSDEDLMDMFQYSSNLVAVQNHSWGFNGSNHYDIPFLENIGIENATRSGRDGRGVVMVRSVPDKRPGLGNANDDGYASDPRVIAVGSVLINGRASGDSDSGACILVAAPGGEFGSSTVFTADRQGSLGYNTSAGSAGDYTVNGSGFFGTSAAAPQVAGVAALILSANTNLGYRDVQQILLHSSRHADFGDPDIVTNAAGFRVSHNVGYGIPDAGFAVQLARNWPNRPAPTNLSFLATNYSAIPDDGLRVSLTGPSFTSLAASPGTGLHPDTPTASLPLVDVGLATTTPAQNLTGKAALITRGGATFAVKLQNAAAAGAAFAVVCNNSDTPARTVMTGTDFSAIPAVLITKSDGDALKNFVATNSVSAQLKLLSTNYIFAVTNQLLCEHVGVRVRTDNLRRADLRITLTSPQGTRSVLQSVNLDPSTNAPIDWTYYSTHHFYESSVGAWTVAFSDEATGVTGVVQEVELKLSGVPIADSDADGLDDSWETTHFGNLANGPKNDPDGDGFCNAREQVMGTNPSVAGIPFQLDLSRADSQWMRLSWPGRTNFQYEIAMGTNIAGLNLTTNVAGRFPETELFLPYANPAQTFFRVRAVALP